MPFPKPLHPEKCSPIGWPLLALPLALYCVKGPVPVILGPVQEFVNKVNEPLLVLYEPAEVPPSLPM